MQYSTFWTILDKYLQKSSSCFFSVISFGWERLLAHDCRWGVNAQNTVAIFLVGDKMYKISAELKDLPFLKQLPGEPIAGFLTSFQYLGLLSSDWVPWLDPWEHSCQKHEFSMYDHTSCMSFPFQCMCISSLLLSAGLIRCVARVDRLVGMISLITPLGRWNYFPSCVQWAGHVFDTLYLQGDDKAKHLV